MAVLDGAILRVVASFLFPESVIAQNVFYTVFSPDNGSADEADVISDLVDWVEAMYTEIDNVIVNDVTTTQIQVYVYDSIDDDWDEVGNSPWSVTMLASADMMPHGCAIIAHCQTSDPDVRGTKYIGGPDDDSAAASAIVGGVLTQMLAFAAEWVTPFVGAVTAGTFGPGIWSPKNTSFFLANGTYSINGDIGYQRRRKPGVGI